MLTLLGELTGSPVRVVHQPPATGDVRRTGGSTELAASVLGWEPTTPLRVGLARQVAWHLEVDAARRARDGSPIKVPG